MKGWCIMGDKVEPVNLATMVNEVLSEYMGDVVEFLKDSAERDAGEALEKDLQVFRSLIRKKDSPASQNLKAVDRIVDKTWRGTRNQIKLSCECPDPKVNSAAQEVWNVISSVPDPTGKHYDLQYGILTVLLDKVEALGEEKLRDALAFYWVKSLREGVDRYHNVKQEKMRDSARQEVGITKKARQILCANYQKLIDRLNAIIILHPDDAHAELNAALNQAIQNRRLTLKLTKKKKKKGEEDGAAEAKAQTEAPIEVAPEEDPLAETEEA